jgi:putative redox protein
MKPPVEISLEWDGDLRFDARAGTQTLVLDSDAQHGLSPMQALALALAGCISMDLVHIIRKARGSLTALHTSLTGRRAAEDPHRFVSFELRFLITGELPSALVDRAIGLSRDRYCSVWHSLRQDIDLQVGYDLRAPEHRGLDNS